MALTTQVSTHELKRIAGLCYEGKAIRICLANSGASGNTVESSTAAWDAVEISGNGYARVTVASLPVGGYDSTTDNRYEIGGTAGANTTIDAAFTASGAGFTYDRVYVVVGTEANLHSLLIESPAVTLSAGQNITYRIQLAVDD